MIQVGAPQVVQLELAHDNATCIDYRRHRWMVTHYAACLMLQHLAASTILVVAFRVELVVLMTVFVTCLNIGLKKLDHLSVQHAAARYIELSLH